MSHCSFVCAFVSAELVAMCFVLMLFICE